MPEVVGIQSPDSYTLVLLKLARTLYYITMYHDTLVALSAFPGRAKHVLTVGATVRELYPLSLTPRLGHSEEWPCNLDVT